MKPRTFAEIYCAQRCIPRAGYTRCLFRDALYPHARLLAPLLEILHRRYFVADYEFVEDVGHLTSVADFSLTMGSYIEHPDNRGLFRRRLRLRVSARRMLHLVRAAFATTGAVLPPAGPDRDTFEPFLES